MAKSVRNLTHNGIHSRQFRFPRVSSANLDRPRPCPLVIDRPAPLAAVEGWLGALQLVVEVMVGIDHRSET
jgi:hypothetical protein